MVKQARRRNRGIPRGVHRHKIQRRLSDSSVTSIEKLISLQSLTRIHGLAKLCWVYLVTSCSKLCLIPLKPSETKRVHFETILFWGQVAHYTIVIAVLALLVHKIIVTLDVMLNEDISIRTYTCICYVLLFFLVASTCCGSTIKSREIQGLLNSWTPILQQSEEITGNRPKLFNTKNLCLKIMAPHIQKNRNSTWKQPVRYILASCILSFGTHNTATCYDWGLLSISCTENCLSMSKKCWVDVLIVPYIKFICHLGVSQTYL